MTRLTVHEYAAVLRSRCRPARKEAGRRSLPSSVRRRACSAVGKEGSGVKVSKRYDEPLTPCQWLLRAGVLQDPSAQLSSAGLIACCASSGAWGSGEHQAPPLTLGNSLYESARPLW